MSQIIARKGQAAVAYDSDGYAVVDLMDGQAAENNSGEPIVRESREEALKDLDLCSACEYCGVPLLDGVGIYTATGKVCAGHVLA